MGGVSRQGPAPVGREQGRRQAERRAETGALLKLRQSLPGSRCCGGEHGAPEEAWLNPGSAEIQCDCEHGPASLSRRLPSYPDHGEEGSHTSPLLCGQDGAWHLIHGDSTIIMINSAVKSH